jgi:hypothetical protein
MVDTVVVVHYDSTIVVHYDSTTIFCDTCSCDSLSDCQTLGKSKHTVTWRFVDLTIAVKIIDPPKANGHTSELCLYVTRTGNLVTLRLTAWRENVQPGQILSIFVNGTETKWDLGDKSFSEMELNI